MSRTLITWALLFILMTESILSVCQALGKRKKAPEGCRSEVHLFEVREKIFKTVKISFYPKQNPHKCKVKTDK